MSNATSQVTSPRAKHRRYRMLVMVVVGVAGIVVTGLIGDWAYAPAVGWTLAALVANTWIWSIIAPMDNISTQSHAQAEDPGRRTSDTLIVLAAVASLAAVAVVMIHGAQAHGGEKLFLAILALSCTAMSWLMVHTLFTLTYAEIYFSVTPGGIEFNQKELPQYTDIAYMAFSVGMTYQVSDTNITTREMRSAVLRHSLLAFVFGTGILATTINLVLSLI